ncbi:Flagellar biosynthesis protein, FliO [Pseudoxanthobacter soli DSM 19599]|uniref:Flagellar biosynthesis protein, FliO n=1 Tax=Pseudoxanthobacter soli DSM 19599 TaxID=1123029 RepID=A0A1M7ZQG0_9HYPH|nr:flagellar biosynthetic protein FliO [Pseudoxanthobacter soli]SHO67052.1 Flagellar biosynthesis protein, FliO [Pseudoxanthobacter soli DSM 19599]
MSGWFEEFGFSPASARLLQMVVAAAIALGAIYVVFRLIGWLQGARSSFRSGRRLSVVEVLPVDDRRRLVLVRRDGAEHLLLVGGPGGDLVVENVAASEIPAGVTPEARAYKPPPVAKPASATVQAPVAPPAAPRPASMAKPSHQAPPPPSYPEVPPPAGSQPETPDWPPNPYAPPRPPTAEQAMPAPGDGIPLRATRPDPGPPPLRRPSPAAAPEPAAKPAETPPAGGRSEPRWP